MTNHDRTSSVPQIRLSQPLPPLPLPPNNLRLQIPYRDHPDPAEEPAGAEQDEEVHSGGPEDEMGTFPPEPPEYQPMYDYLRSKQALDPHASTSSTGFGDLRIMTDTPVEPYRDDPEEPFVVDIDGSEPPPPSYTDFCREHAIELQSLEQTLDEEEVDPVERTEDICKWIVAMLLITLTVASVGTAFNWGRPYCRYGGPRC